jgi:hypothetical protein
VIATLSPADGDFGFVVRLKLGPEGVGLGGFSGFSPLPKVRVSGLPSFPSAGTGSGPCGL